MRTALDRGGLTLAQTAVASFTAAPTSDTSLTANPSEDFDYDYVLDVQPTAHSSGLALALSNRKIQLRSLETLGLVHEFHAHNATINEVWTSSSSPTQLATCSSDECVKLWDTRAALPAMVVPVGREVWSLSIGCGETLLATGTDELALFYDVRTGKQLGQYGESHVDAITKVRFHPTQPAFVVTASEDGVVCFFDCRISDEDDALESILNVESAVTTVGFFGPQKENIFCLTGTETLDLWNLWTAERLHHYNTIRDDCNSNGLATDYLINCVYDDQSNELFLLAGNHDGDLNAVNIGTDVASAGKLQHAAALKGGHKACVRCVYYDPNSSTLYTGGEDTRLCKWTVPGAPVNTSDGNISTPSSRKATGLDPAGIRKARKASRPY
ncbi:WD repeat-containing protein 89 [Phytophthora citrophthora]|uniref:WD repeat-containing protein 89 n=1 Tax=Phytophthora citrophthora TaxID=4793 RepID=A0AAD9LB77_9STRA|nr:WD repeat-containing protein 89 [Phytophthora citrophthora]